MRPREYFLVAFSILVAAVCVRLGFWQISRLQERRAYNAGVVARLDKSPVPVRQAPRDSASARFRIVTFQGTYDYSHEIVLSGRIRLGSPGVYIITPVRLQGSDTALLVNRGWVYSPDATNVDLSRWRESDTVTGVGYIQPFGEARKGSPRSPTKPNAYRWLDSTVVDPAFPYPVLPFTVVLQSDSAVRPNVPPRVEPPPLSDGPHVSYAIQWFTFALIAVIGSWFFSRRARLTKQGVTKYE